MSHAFDIQIDLKDLAELEDQFQRAPDIVRQELLAATTEADLLLEREVREGTPVGVGAGGGLRGSIHSEEMALADNVIGVTGTSMPHALPVELGTRPHFPPIEPLKDWVKQKLDVPPDQVDEVALAVARKIAAHGTKGAHMFANAFASNRTQVLHFYQAAQQRIVNRMGGAA